MAKIGLLTFHAAHNYGSMLQAYALQATLSSMGHDVKIINLRTMSQNFMYINPLQYLTFRKVKTLFLHPTILLGNVRKWYNFESFMKSNYNLTRKIFSLSQTLAVINEEGFDYVVTGGDQIWNMNCQDFILSYYLPFKIDNVKKISYSPSFGDGESWEPEPYSNILKTLLANYTSLSIRDEKGHKFLTHLMGRDIPVVPDPAFLLSKEHYDGLAGNKPIVKGRYMFYYSPLPDAEIEKVCINYAKKNKLDIITSTGEYYHCAGMKKKLSVGPVEFLNLIKYADIVCGKSFHMVAFCLIMQKKFLAVTGNTDYRIKSILDMLSLNGNACPKDADGYSISIPETNWQEVSEKLREYKQIGLNYLSNSIR